MPAVTTISCPGCGVHVHAEAVECPECGHVLAKTLSTTAIVLLVLVLGVVVLAVVWFIQVGFDNLDLGL